METLSNISSVPVVPIRNQGGAQLPLKKTSQASQPLPAPKRSEGFSDQKLAEAEAKRLDRLRQAAESFVLGDQSFSIYKDATGQLITRFTSLRDGRVTYIPEPNLLAKLESKQGIDPSLSFSV